MSLGTCEGGRRNHAKLPTVPRNFNPDGTTPETNRIITSRSFGSRVTEAESRSDLNREAGPQILRPNSSVHDNPEKNSPIGGNNEHDPESKRETRQWQILLAAATIFLPILAISLVLLGFTFYGAVRLTLQSDHDINADATVFPVVSNPSHSHFYSDVKSAPFVLVGSWASNVALGPFTPFILLFSFLVAWMAITESNTEPSPIMHGLLKGSQVGELWKWLEHISMNAFSRSRTQKTDSRSLYIAGVGFSSAFVMR